MPCVGPQSLICPLENVAELALGQAHGGRPMVVLVVEWWLVQWLVHVGSLTLSRMP